MKFIWRLCRSQSHVSWNRNLILPSVRNSWIKIVCIVQIIARECITRHTHTHTHSGCPLVFQTLFRHNYVYILINKNLFLSLVCVDIYWLEQNRICHFCKQAIAMVICVFAICIRILYSYLLATAMAAAANGTSIVVGKWRNIVEWHLFCLA